MQGILRRIAQRVCCAYRTVSFVAASLISGTPPVEFQARRLAIVYFRTRNAIEVDEEISPGTRAKWYREAKQQVLSDWRESLMKLNHTHPSFRLREALVDRLKEWVNRRHGWVTYHMTQFLTNHGCFNEFLHKIRKADSAICYHCLDAVDTAQHTLQFCSAWSADRTELTRVIGDQLDLPSVIESILDSIDKWRAFSVFCTKVLTCKEAAERQRQAANRKQITGHMDSEISE
nr:PREDICTED: uncharacterized protein LOC105680054 [Linepithema humile]